MDASAGALWERYRRYRCDVPAAGLSLDISRVHFDEAYLARMTMPAASALQAMEALEAGAIANADERRMVGHYWLRAPERAPDAETRRTIAEAIASVGAFARRVRDGGLRAPGGARFEHVLHVGIGGSALGPQFACAALQRPDEWPMVTFLDNADPDGVHAVAAQLGAQLDRTLVSIVSKSGVTPTPAFVERELAAIFARRGLDLARQAVATTMPGSDLDRRASAEGWLARFPLWAWVGGRTSVTSAVGLLPLALQGADIAAFLAGAAAMDAATREPDVRRNPAALLALMWHAAGEGRGAKHMVVLAYRDRLALLARYVQQLVMESIGKTLDRGGAVVHQGLTVYGHKGSTDQHAYVQQLRDGRHDFFVTFVGVQQDADEPAAEMLPGVTLGDTLFGSLEGTRDALYARGRESITITLADTSAGSIGALIALFERAVGLYAELIDVNAYHQPGVDKFVAAGIVTLQQQVLDCLAQDERPRTASEIAEAIGHPDRVETIYKLLEHLAMNARRGVRMSAGERFDERFSLDRAVAASVPSGADADAAAAATAAAAAAVTATATGAAAATAAAGVSGTSASGSAAARPDSVRGFDEHA